MPVDFSCASAENFNLKRLVRSLEAHRRAAAPCRRPCSASDGPRRGEPEQLSRTQLSAKIYKIDPAGEYQELFSFGSSAVPGLSPDGAYPSAGLIFGPDGNLYGTTTQWGVNTGGTLFKITPAGELTTLVAFGGPAPAQFQAYAPLYVGSDGYFYGTTNVGGTVTNSGTLFRLTPDGVETVLWDFGFGGNGGFSTGFGLVEGADGNLYGVTSGGGAAAGGTLFKLIL